jgi:hypothetical protein
MRIVYVKKLLFVVSPSKFEAIISFIDVQNPRNALMILADINGNSFSNRLF